MSADPVRVLVADDHPLFRDGLRVISRPSYAIPPSA
jgi:DNA-binding NarL/FixJ family response regulator